MGAPGGRGRAVFAALLVGALASVPLAGAPAATPGASPAAGEAPLTVTFSPNDPDGALYQWQFDQKPGGPFVADYSSEIGEPVAFTYTAPGTYTAVLRLHDAFTGAVQDHPLAIQVFPPAVPPVVSVSSSAQPAAKNAVVTFTATAVASPGRSIVSYSWDLDHDGAIDVINPPGPSGTAARAFATSGVHTIAVTAVDSGGLGTTETFDLRVSVAPFVLLSTPAPAGEVVGVPVDFAASAGAEPPWSIASWSWDFGDGTVLTDPPPVSHTYLSPGQYTVRVTAVDTSGMPGHRELTYDVAVRPAIFASTDQQQVHVRVRPAGADTVAGFDWDYDNDGTVDDSTAGAEETTYIAPTGPLGITAHLSPAGSLSKAVDVVIVGAEATIVTPPVMTLFTDVDGAMSIANSGPAANAPISIRVGHVARFELAVQSVASTPRIIAAALWDFEDDGLRDQTDDLLPLNSSTVFGIPAEFQFQTAGRVTVRVRAIEQGGDANAVVLPFDVLPGSGTLETWISQPRPGQRVWGDRVSLQARASPAVRVGRIDFDFRPAGGGSWTRIGTAVPPPYTSLGVSWDVTRIPPGDYDLRAVATSVDGLETFDSETLRAVRVTVDPAAPDVEEFGGAGGSSAVRVHSIDPSSSSRTEIAGDTAIEFPPAAFAARATVRMERPASNPHPLEARQQNLHFVPGSFRRLNMVGQTTLDKPSRIALYDLNPGGVLDTLAVDKTRLRIFQFDDTRREWVPLISQVIQPNEDLARATFMSMGDIGLVVDRTPGDGGTGSSGGCGLLGTELLVAAGLLALARRRRIPNF